MASMGREGAAPHARGLAWLGLFPLTRCELGARAPPVTLFSLRPRGAAAKPVCLRRACGLLGGERVDGNES